MTQISFVPIGSTILLTGANGYVGMHVARELLESGFQVKGTVRSLDKTELILQVIDPRFHSRLSFVVEDLESPQAFQNSGSLIGVDAILHVASPIRSTFEDSERDLLRPAVDGMLQLLRAADQFPTIKRIVITSSLATVVDSTKGLRPDYIYTENDWSPVTWSEAKETKNWGLARAASKTFAERAAWEFFRASGSSHPYDLVTLCPSLILGPSMKPARTVQDISGSLRLFWSGISQQTLPPTMYPSYIDVRDLARIQRLALQLPDLGGQRYLISGGSFSFAEAANIVASHIPNSKAKISNQEETKLPAYIYDNNKMKRDFIGLELRSKEETIVDTAKQLYTVSET